MEFYTINKIAGALLGTAMVVLGVYIVSTEIFNAEPAEEAGEQVAAAVSEGPAPAAPGEAPAEVAQAPAAPAPGGPAPAEPAGGPPEAGAGFVALVANGDVAAGEASARVCAGCHSFGSGEANRVGPNLYGVIGRTIGGHEGYAYSDAFAALAAGGETWTVERMGAFLLNPRGDIPGTKMGFAGIPDEANRANVVAYLHSLSDSPVPLDAGAPAGDQQAQAPAPAEPAPAEPAPAAPAPAEPAPAEPAPAAPAPAGGGDLAAAIGAADAAAGQTFSARCAACHSFDEGGPNRVGPNLYDIVGRVIGGHEGYSYSDAFAALATAGETWTLEKLDAFLLNPREDIPGTKMGFAGVPSDTDRHNLIAYLRTLSANPAPLQ